MFSKQLLAGLMGVAFLCVGAMCHGDTDERALRVELDFIEALQLNRMPDIAAEVIAEVKRNFPAAAAALKVSEVKGLLLQGSFAEVQKVIDEIKDKNSEEFWALTLAKADAHYAYGQHAEADKLYGQFFKAITKPTGGLVTFYRDSAYRYVQMLIHLKRDMDALKAFGYLLDATSKPKIPLDEGAERLISADKAELILKMVPEIKDKKEQEKLLKEAESAVDKLLWHQDVWFGKAIVMKAHIHMVRGGVKAAQDMVELYMPQLKELHDSLRKQDADGSLGYLRMSPMPQCRFLLAQMLENEARAETKKAKANEDLIKDLLLGERNPQTKRRAQNGALNHYYNIFIRYPESQWAADAGVRAEALRGFIQERYNADVGIRVTEEQMRRVREMQFADARQTFSQNQFKEAIDKYLLVLNQFPETPESVSALGDLAISYIGTLHEDREADIEAMAVAGHLAERFAGQERFVRSVGDQLRRIGDSFGERKLEEQRRATYALYFQYYPTHYAAGQLVMSFGERELKAQNYSGAMGYFKQVTATYTDSPYYIDAFARIAQIHKETGAITNEMAALEEYIAKLSQRERPGRALIAAKCRLGDAFREYGTKMVREAGAAEELDEAALDEANKAAVDWIKRAVQIFDEVTKHLSQSADAYQVSEADKKANEKLLELSYFSKAVCLTQINYPPAEVEGLRKLALAAYEEYVGKYPRGIFGARALMQVGTLHTVLKNTEQAQGAFERLARDFPTSDEAKNSVPMQAAALIEIGLRGEGVAKYRQMLDAGGNYTEGQFMAAAQALEAAREYAVAERAYNKVLQMTKDIGQKATAKLGIARTYMGMKRFGDALKELREFISDENLKKLLLVVDANMLLAEVASEEGKKEKAHLERTQLFNEAVSALKMAKLYRTNMVDQVGLDIQAGEIMSRKMEAEKDLGLDEQSVESRGKAIVAFQVIIMNIDPTRADLASALERAYALCLPLLLEHGKYKDAQEDAERYLELFPEGKYKAEVQNWLNQAKVNL